MKNKLIKKLFCILILTLFISTTFVCAYTPRYDKKDRARVGWDLFWKFSSEFFLDWGWFLLLIALVVGFILWLVRGKDGGQVQFVQMPPQR